MRLLRSEFLRARSRRLVPMVIIGGLIAILVGLGIAAVYSSPPSDAKLAEAQQRADQDYDRCVKGRYLGPDGQVPAGYASLEEFCEDNSGPFIADAGVQLRDLADIVMGIATFVVLLGALLGASLGGADWTNDTITTLLTWEPRRIRVLLVRAFVVVVFVFTITIVLQTVFASVYWLVASTRGTTAFVPSHLWSDTWQVAARTSTVATAFALVALSLAMIGRSTVASLGVLVGYLILFEGVIAGFRQSIQGWLLMRAGIVVITQTPILRYDTGEYYSGSGYVEPTVLMSVSRANLVLGAYVIGLLVLALVVFRRRDIT
jgi:ABC-2 type transport system permease protein